MSTERIESEPDAATDARLEPVDERVDALLDAQDVDAGVDPPAADPPDSGDAADSDVSTASCGPNEVRVGGDCQCASGFYEAPDGRCVECLGSDHCGDRVCVTNACRSCQSDDECAPRFCGDDGLCADAAPECTTEGERRCRKHQVQYCVEESWQDDASGECSYGCNNDTGGCYPDSNVGWIGGRCDLATDCQRMDPSQAVCLNGGEGFVEGTCSQRCTSVCPDQSGPTDTITFCIDSLGLNDAGICVSRCDFSLFSDAGCRRGYECRERSRLGDPGRIEAVCLPVNWWRDPNRRFDFGIAAGDVTHQSAVVWAHTGSVDADVAVEYGTDADALAGRVATRSTAVTGYTAQVTLTRLTPDADYVYQVVVDDLVASPLGHFRTAPAPGAAPPVHMLVSGDVHQSRLHLADIFETMRAHDADVFISMGDWPYADAATTVEDYRDITMSGRADPRIRDFLASRSVVTLFDDHEVYNDWDAAYAAANPEAVANGLRVWSEWWPLSEPVPGEFYRSLRWGEIELFALDARTHRDPRAQTDDIDKSMLGVEQREWLLDALEESDAVFKLILTSVPFDFTTTGSDSWRGYTTERALIVDAIVERGVSGVVLLAADQHWFGAHHYASGLKEFQTGPLTASLRTPPATRQLEQVDIVEAYNFGELTYDPTARELLFEAFGADGELLYSERVRAGRGRIAVDSNVLAGFTICPHELLGPDCAHFFRGQAPTVLEYAAPGPYQIVWEPRGGYTPAAQALVLEDGDTITFSASYPGGELPFIDTFDDDTGWVALDEGTIDDPSDWELSTLDGDPVLVQHNNIYDTNSAGPGALAKLGTLVANGSPDWTDYVLDVWVRASDNDGLGVMARYADGDHYYRFSLDNQRRFARLVKRVDGAFTLLDEETEAFASVPPYTTNVWTELSLVVDGPVIEAYVDGELVLEAVDFDLDAGGVGLYSWGSTELIFDDVSVQGLQ